MFELAALAAAICWALNSLIAAAPSQALGAVKFNLIRMTIVSIGLSAYVSVVGGWGTIGMSHLQALILSGLIGVFLGDTAQFLALNRLGPRKTSLLFSLHAPIATFLGWLFLNETLKFDDIVGIVMCFLGVLLAIAYGSNSVSSNDNWEVIRGDVWIALSLGLLAALFQAFGSLIIRPALLAGADPIASSAIRMGVSAFALAILSGAAKKIVWQTNKITLPILMLTAISGALGMGLGMTLIMYALVGAEVGIVSTLASTTPVIMLPLLWIKSGKCPEPLAWIGAVLVALGCGLIFT